MHAITSTNARTDATFGIPKRAQRKLAAKARKAEIVQKSTVPERISRHSRALSPTTQVDTVNIMVTRFSDTDLQSRRRMSGKPEECILIALPATALREIVLKLSEKYSVLSVLSMTHTCRTLADRIAMCKIVKLEVANPAGSVYPLISDKSESFAGTLSDPVEMARMQYAQIQIDDKYPTVHHYGISMDIKILSETHAVLKKKAASGVWRHSICIKNGIITHVHSESGIHRVARYHIGIDTEQCAAEMFEALKMTLSIGHHSTKCFIATSTDIPSDASSDDDEIIHKLIALVDKASAGRSTPAVIVADDPIKKMVNICKIIRGWSSAMDDILTNPNQLLMRTIANEPITRWSTETIQEGVAKAIAKTPWTDPKMMREPLPMIGA